MFLCLSVITLIYYINNRNRQHSEEVAILVEILLVPVEKEEQQNVILGQAHL